MTVFGVDSSRRAGNQGHPVTLLFAHTEGRRHSRPQKAPADKWQGLLQRAAIRFSARTVEFRSTGQPGGGCPHVAGGRA
jgi:hypothetical protein